MPPVERFPLMRKCSLPVPMKSSAGMKHVFIPLKVIGTAVATAVSALTEAVKSNT